MSVAFVRAALIGTTLASALLAQSQNCTLLSRVDKFPGAQSPTNNYAGVFGAVSGGRELALVGARSGTIIYDCTNPSAPVEVGFISGPGSTSMPYFWREPQSFGTFGYISSEHGPLQVINLSNPTTPTLSGTFGGTAHTVSIDPGARTLWANGGSGNGCVIYNLASSPTNPPQLGTYTQAYVHDALPVRGFVYLAQIFNGTMRIMNTQNLPTLTSVSTTVTPGSFTHNVGVTDDDKTAVTCDENRGGCMTVYDITNKAAPIQRATWCSPHGATAHNVVVKGQVAHLSSYSGGYYAIDISRPATPELISWYDTSSQSNNDYHGCWGAYPFTSSGAVYLSDMQSGFWIVQPTCGVPVDYGTGTAGTSGNVPVLDYGGGFARVGRSTFQFVGTKIKPNAQVALIVGAAQGSTSILGITLLVDVTQPNIVVSATADATGNVVINAPIPSQGSLANATFYAQLVTVDTGGPQGLAASRGMKLAICP